MNAVLLTITGRDRPGISAALTGILAAARVELLDMEQVTVQGQLTLCLLVSEAGDSLLVSLREAALRLGVALSVAPLLDAAPGLASRWVVTVIGRALGAAELHDVTAELAARGANLDRIVRLAAHPLAAFEMHASLAVGLDPEPLRRGLLAAGARRSYDVALQRESLYRRSKRLVVLDMDSTLIRIEVIDELARVHGVGEEVARITERAMAGEIDYDESLRRRVGLLAGLSFSVVERIAAELPLTEGAETLLRALRRLGYRTAVLSGGFSVAAAALQQRLGIDWAHSNVLEVEGGKLTGRVQGPIVNARRKAELLESIAASEGVLLDQVIAVGDGANDLLMLERAGLGIAFHAKPRLREQASTALSASGLDAILYLLGLSAREIAEVG